MAARAARLLGAWLIMVRSCWDSAEVAPQLRQTQPHNISWYEHFFFRFSSRFCKSLLTFQTFLPPGLTLLRDKSINMVLLGGLEIVAAGYLIHKHQQNKKDRQRLEDEAAALEESQYRIFPPDQRPSSSQHRRRRSHSHEREERHSHERRDRRDRYDRPHSADGKYRRESPRRESVRPPKAQMNIPPPQQQQMPIQPSFIPPPAPQQSAMRPPPPPLYNTVPTATAAPPQDVKYGWTDESARRPLQDPNYPPTGWPAHWAQSQTPPARTGTPQSQRGEPSRGRHERRNPTPEANTSRVRFAVPDDERSPSRSPPPSYRD